jgi:hypothetical protein
MKVNGQLHARASLSPENSPRYQLNRMLLTRTTGQWARRFFLIQNNYSVNISFLCSLLSLYSINLKYLFVFHTYLLVSFTTFLFTSSYTYIYFDKIRQILKYSSLLEWLTWFSFELYAFSFSQISFYFWSVEKLYIYVQFI